MKKQNILTQIYYTITALLTSLKVKLVDMFGLEELPTDDFVELFDFICNGEGMTMDFIGGPNAQLLIHGIQRDSNWLAFKNKHTDGLITELCLDKPCLMEPYSEVGFRIDLHDRSIVDIEFIGSIAGSRYIMSTNIVPIDETVVLRDTACPFIKKLPNTYACFCIKRN